MEEPAGTVRLMCGASAGRGPEDFQSSTARCGCRPGAGRCLVQYRAVRVPAGGRKMFGPVPCGAGAGRGPEDFWSSPERCHLRPWVGGWVVRFRAVLVSDCAGWSRG